MLTRGIVKWYDAKEGRGFIQRDEGPDVLLPASALGPARPVAPVEGQAVEFEMFAIPGGFRARNVRVVGAAPGFGVAVFPTRKTDRER